MTVLYEIIAYLIERETFSRALRGFKSHHLNHCGWLVEWFKTTVLKTVVLKSTVGSNPTSSAIIPQ